MNNSQINQQNSLVPKEKPSTLGFVVYTVIAVLLISNIKSLDGQFFAICAAVGLWALHKHNLKSNVEQYHADKTDWQTVGKRILEIRECLNRISSLPIKAENDDCTDAETCGDGFSWYKTSSFWVLSATVYVENERFSRRHGKKAEDRYSGSYIGLRYPYPDYLKTVLERLDQSCDITLYDSGYGSINFYLNISANVSPQVIRTRLSAVNLELMNVTRSLPASHRKALTFTR